MTTTQNTPSVTIAGSRTVQLGVGFVNAEMLYTRPNAVVGTLEPVSLDFAESAHALLLGGAGSGKTAQCQNILVQWLEAGHLAAVAGPEWGAYDLFAGAPGVLCVRRELTSIVDLLESLLHELGARFDRLSAAKVVNYADLPAADTFKPILVVIDNEDVLAHFRVAEGDVVGAEINQMAEIAQAHLATLVRLGRVVGIHVIVATQRADFQWARPTVDGPDRSWNELKMNLGTRILMGNADKVARLMAGFPEKSEVAATPGIRGRGLFGVAYTTPQEVQFAHLSLAQVKERLDTLRQATTN